ncbi:MAG: rhomboid family intramembrane serine protease [Flavobacterium sp. BFFFF1]|uniref:rhomboid family intramembrane serine protease n=1 Tax=Flavobacterium sp. BFFFF1 TaxID=2015557 RepID=UPI000BD87BD8|nr:rhomboid family intramembrane serine protease [Flavobacterium sp. BFFFF1]OYU80535.1 MAG: rhomboid family intramembrane serine protease [Flavobacterium sp. BFFFF1]
MGLFDDLKLEYKLGGVTQQLIFWNIGIFIVSIILFYNFKGASFSYPDWLALSPDPLIVLSHPWTLVTYAFLHSGFMHILFNMLMLNFSGMLFLTYFKEKQLLGLYFLSAIFAGLVFCLSFFLLGYHSSIVGASAAIISILMAATTYNPRMPIRLLLIGRIQLWHLTAVLLVLDLMYILVENTGGHISHLAGAFFGFIYIVLLRRGIDLSKGVTVVTDWVMGLFRPAKKTPFKKVHRNSNRRMVPETPKSSGKDPKQQQIDEILDKISKSGYDSLTQQEKDFLFNASK